MLPAHLLADSETAQQILFKKQLSLRECARKAFHSADNDAALRRSILRRSRPGTCRYVPGEWVMVWKQNNGALPSRWIGPMRVVVHENHQTVWTTMLSKLYRVSPEHVRPVTASEARDIQIDNSMTPISTIAQQLTDLTNRGTTQAIDANGNPNIEVIPHQEGNPPANIETPHEHTENEVADQSSGHSQPDQEPEVPSGPMSEGPSEENPGLPADGLEVPIPDNVDDDLVCEGLYCLDVEDNHWIEDTPDSAWRFDVVLTQEEIDQLEKEDQNDDYLFVVSAAKKQRAEVKLQQLNHEEKLFSKRRRSPKSKIG